MTLRDHLRSRQLQAVVLTKGVALAACALAFGGNVALVLGLLLGVLGVGSMLVYRVMPSWLGALLVICASVAFVPVVTTRLDARISAAVVLAAMLGIVVLLWHDGPHPGPVN
ncbi:MAG: hypothetical protein WC876_11405 [Candidatus Thermoplasmatota archaeon]|jgi:hypothetical protein